MKGTRVKRIGILTGGGDCPGLNAVIRAVAKTAMNHCHAEVMGIEDGFEGMVENRKRLLRNEDVSGIITQGGTILGTSNKGDPWHYPSTGKSGRLRIIDTSQKVIANYRRWKLDALITIGGDGTMAISRKLAALGANIVGVPKTIDNDLAATDLTFGHDSAVSIATEGIDRLHTTASSHHRVMVIEVMGRYAGWIALGSGLAGGADLVLIPEIPFKWDCVYRSIERRNRRGKRFSIVCVAEGAKCPDRGEVVKKYDRTRTDAKQLGGIGDFVANKIRENTGRETRVTVLGHLLRGGTPTAFDRVLATKFGVMACVLAASGKFGRMVALRGNKIDSVTIEEATNHLKLVTQDDQLVLAARAVGTSFGDK